MMRSQLSRFDALRVPADHRPGPIRIIWRRDPPQALLQNVVSGIPPPQTNPGRPRKVRSPGLARIGESKPRELWTPEEPAAIRRIFDKRGIDWLHPEEDRLVGYWLLQEPQCSFLRDRTRRHLGYDVDQDLVQDTLYDYIFGYQAHRSDVPAGVVYPLGNVIRNYIPPGFEALLEIAPVPADVRRAGECAGGLPTVGIRRKSRQRRKKRGLVRFWPYHLFCYKRFCRQRGKKMRRLRALFDYSYLPVELTLRDGTSDRNPESRIMRKEQMAAVSDALNDLRPRRREIIVLRFFENYSTQETARTLGVPQGTVTGELFRGRIQMAEFLAKRGVR
jgi:RNA polymerase sigma factor (sigma-70 family)